MGRDYDPQLDFDRYRVHEWNDDAGRGWAVVDKVTGSVVSRHPSGYLGRTGYRDAKADAAERNLQVYREVNA